MPDNALPVAEGGRPGGGGGSHWLVIGAVAGIGTLAVLLLQKGDGGAKGTTAAGTSINAALGSIQEQNLNLMGEIGRTDQHLSSELGNINGNIIVGNQSLHDQLMNNTYMNYYQSAYYYGLQMANQVGQTAESQAAWLAWAKQFPGAIEEGRVGGYGVTPPAYHDVDSSHTVWAT